MTDALALLWDSTAALYAAHGLDAESVPPSKRRRYFSEEADELKEASVVLDEWAPVPEMTLGNLEVKLADEAADTLVTLCGLLQAHGISREAFEAACQRVMAKNDSKRQPEWVYANGKIRKAEGMK